MKQVSLVDENGLFIEPVIVEDEQPLSKSLIDVEVPQEKGFYHPKWDFTNKEWVEGLIESAIEEIENTPVPKTELELMKEDLEAAKQETAEMNLAIIEILEMLA